MYGQFVSWCCGWAHLCEVFWHVPGSCLCLLISCLWPHEARMPLPLRRGTCRTAKDSPTVLKIAVTCFCQHGVATSLGVWIHPSPVLVEGHQQLICHLRLLTRKTLVALLFQCHRAFVYWRRTRRRCLAATWLISGFQCLSRYLSISLLIYQDYTLTNLLSDLIQEPSHDQDLLTKADQYWQN